MALLQVTSNKPGASTTTLVNGSTDTGYVLLSDAEWGNAVWEMAYSGQRGTQGARSVGGTPQNRPLVLPFRVSGTSKDNLLAKISDLSELGDDLRRFGGRVTWKSNSQSYRQHFDVMAGAASVREWGNRAESKNRTVMVLEASCGPYLLGDSFDIADDFSTDTLSTDYTFDAGSGTLSVSGGQLVPSSTAVKQFYHSGRGYAYGDCQMTLKYTTGASVAGDVVSMRLKRLDSSNYLEGEFFFGAGGGHIRKVVAGSATDLTSSSSGTFTRAANTTYWIRFRIEGNVVTLEHWATEPTPLGTPTGTLISTLSGSEVTTFGAAVTGGVGISLAPGDTNARYDEFRVEPYTYRNLSLPDEIALRSALPGDAPALCDLTVTPSGGSAAPIWAAAAWAKRAEIFNMVWNGDFEDDTNGWTVAAVGITGAATSINRVTTSAKYGVACGEIVTPATANTGTTFTIYRRFRKGITYTATLWVRAATATTNANVIFGVSGDNGSTTPAALSSTWTVRTVTWTPLVDRDTAYIAFQVTAATATTMQIDGVQVYEGTTAPTVGKHSEGQGAYPPLGTLEAESHDTGDASGWAITANGSARFGQELQWTPGTGAATAAAQWFIDPHLLLPDDYTQGELSIEVWAQVKIYAGLVSPKLTLSARPAAGTSFGNERYSNEWGSTGKLLTKPASGSSYRFVRLGTLNLAIDRTRPARWKLRIAGAVSAGSGAADRLDIDYLWLAPSRARACSPSSKANDSSFPKFVSSTSETSKTIRSDLSGLVSKPPQYAHPDHGLGGSLLELPPGNTDLALKLSSLVPDDPTSDTTTEQLSHSATVHAAITPRWAMFRDA